MGSPEAFLISGMSSSSLDGDLTKSLSPALSDNSALNGLGQTFRFSASTSFASSGLDRISTNGESDSSVLEGIFGNFDGHKNFQFTQKDAYGNLETFSLTGDGEGEVFKSSNFEQIIFKGTDATTKVQISASDNLKFGDYIGSELNVQTKGSITTSNILSNGGAINLISYQESVTTKGDITTSGGAVSLQGNKVIAISGTLDASNLANGHKGGSVQVLGNTVALLDQAQINVSGDSGGGTVLIGGDYQGKGAVPNAQSTFISSSARVYADAINSGNGGKVVVWSDDTTHFLGNISARGGSKSGNGGMVEVSGKQLLDFQGMVYANAVNGLAGTLLLDPKNIIIDNSEERAAYISGSYNYWDNYGGTGTASNQNAMNAAFGAGNWDNLSLTSAGANPFATGTGNDYKFIFLDGGDSQAVNLSNYLATNSASIDAWVKQGGHLFINAAPNVGGSFSLGFGVTLNYDASNYFATNVVAAEPSHPIFNGSFLPTSTAFSGDYFSHATVSGGGITPIILRNSGSGGDQNIVQGNGYGGNQNVVQGNGYGGNQNVVQGGGYGGNQNVVQGGGYGGDQNVVQGGGYGGDQNVVQGGGIVLGEEPVGQGLALFGGMTTANFHTPQASANNLLVNILEYASAPTPTPLSANDTFAQNPDVTTTISPAQITKITNAGTAVVLQANNDITVNKAITTTAVGSGGSLTLQAGRSININANITTDNGDLTLLANDSDAVAAQRDPGAAVITMANGTTLNAGTGKVSISLNQGTKAGNNSIGDVTIGSISSKQVDILSDGGVYIQSDIKTDGVAVGDATTNGTAAAISTGTDTISPLKSFSGNTHLGSIDIITQGSVPLLSESPSKSDSDKELGKSQGTQPDSNSILLADNSTVNRNVWPSQIHLSTDKQQQLEGFIKQLWNVGQPLAEFVLGTMYQFLYDNGAPIRSLLQPLQLTPKEEAIWERTLPHSTAFKLGRTVGGGATIVQGIVEFLVGSGAEAGGGGLCFTGIGCFAGAPAIAVGAILQSHGAATTILSAREEGKLLRELLSPDRFESSTSGSSELATELGANQGQIEKALSVLPPGEIRQLHGELGQDLFEQLLKKDQKVIHDVSRTLDLAGNDTVASNAIAETLRLNKKGTIGNDDLGKAISNLVNFMQRYQGKVFGDFATRFSRELYLVKKRPDQALQARGEIKAAEDFLEGRTELGSSSRIEGLTESTIQNVETPEFRVTGADGVTRLAEVKTIQGPLGRNGIKNNLKKAFSQIKTQAQVTHETGGYVRIDASTSKSTTLTRDEISRYVKGELLDFAKKGGDYVEFVEVLYNDTAGQSQKLLFKLQKGNIVISP